MNEKLLDLKNFKISEHIQNYTEKSSQIGSCNINHSDLCDKIKPVCFKNF